MSRSLTALLTTLAITGVLASLAARSEQKPIREEYEQLLAIVGNLNVEDPEQLCAVRIPTEAPDEFSWRLYCPANTDISTQTHGIAGSSRSSRYNRQGSESRVYVRFQFTDDTTQIFLKSPGGSSTRSFGDAKTARFLREHWQQFEVHSGDTSDPIAADEDQALQLLSIRIPESLHPQIRQQLGGKSQLLQGLLLDVHTSTPKVSSTAGTNGR